MANYSSTKEDLRSRVTKLMLSNALLECFRTMTYPEISVIKICNVAQVHRTTFYKHFETKDDLLRYAMFRKYISPEIEFEKKNKTGNTPRENFFHLMNLMLDIFLNDKDYFHMLFSTRENDAIILMLIRLLTDFVECQLEGKEEDKDIPPGVIAEFTAGGVVTFINSCVRLKMPYTKEKMMTYISKLTVFY